MAKVPLITRSLLDQEKRVAKEIFHDFNSPSIDDDSLKELILKTVSIATNQFRCATLFREAGILKYATNLLGDDKSSVSVHLRMQLIMV